uniref:NADH dehydrogenase subunit 4 n=1 Tax=Struwela camposi TaxID=2859449 RepID=UPI0030FEF737
MLKMMFPLVLLLLLPTSNILFLWHSSALILLILPIYFLPSFFQTPPIHISGLMTSDSLSSPLLILTLWISALMIFASYKILNMHSSPRLFIQLILTLALILILTFTQSNLLLFYIMFEASLIPTLFIILGWGNQPERLQAGMYLVLYTVAASLPLLLSISTIYSLNSSLFFPLYMWSTPLLPTLWWAASILAFLAKMPLYSLHLWLPKAHVEAPVAGSMILAAILLKLGGYGLIRFASLFYSMNSLFMPFLLSLTLWGAVITSFICLRQTDLKALIAYSSVGHMGLMTAGIMSNSSWGYEGALIMMIAHGLSSSGLFAIANSLYESTHTRSLFLTKGMQAMFPIMSLLWFILSIANMAAPPSLNLIAEISLFSSILSASTLSAFPLFLSSLLAGAYSLFLFTATQHGHPSSYQTPTFYSSPRNIMLASAHLYPLFFIVMKLDLSSSWL